MYNDKNLRIEEGLDFFLYKEKSSGRASFKIRFVSTKVLYFDRLVRFDGGDGRIRWGISSKKGEQWSDWRNVFFLNPKISYRRGVVLCSIGGVDGGWRLSESFRQRGYIDWSISDIVQEIADFHKMTVDIEPTAGKFNLWQCHLSDNKFVREVLLSRALSVSGRSDFVFGIKNGSEIVFRPPVYGEDVINYTLGPVGDDENYITVEQLNIVNRKLQLIKEDSWRVRFIGFDVLQKVPIVFDADDTTVAYDRLESVPPTINNFTSVRSIVEPTSEHYRVEDARAAARSLWADGYRGRFRMSLKFNDEPKATPGMMINFNVKTSDDYEPFFGGRYFVYETVHTIRKTSLETELRVERRTSR